ncbi:MAG: hypothetical protein MUE52_09335 [Tabrizicola sp.]|jgi:hypothetical protein|nr:hypothetical protein [Tabrizicola sp.]
MLSRQIALLCSLAMLGSLFLPWVITPIGNNIVPWDVLPPFDRAEIEAYLRAQSTETHLFLASFFLAAFFFFLALIGREKGWIAILTGLCAVGYAGLMVWRDRERLGFAEMEMTTEQANLLIAEASAVLGTGGWVWIGGAALLLLLGLFDPGTAKPKPQPVTSSRW